MCSRVDDVVASMHPLLHITEMATGAGDEGVRQGAEVGSEEPGITSGAAVAVAAVEIGGGAGVATGGDSVFICYQP